MIGWLAHHFVHPFLAGIGLFLAASLVLWHYASRVFPEWATGARRRWVPPTLEPVLRLASLRRWAVLSLLWLAVARPYWTDALSNGPMALFLIDFSRSAEGLQIPIDQISLLWEFKPALMALNVDTVAIGHAYPLIRPVWCAVDGRLGYLTSIFTISMPRFAAFSMRLTRTSACWF